MSERKNSLGGVSEPDRAVIIAALNPFLLSSHYPGASDYPFLFILFFFVSYEEFFGDEDASFMRAGLLFVPKIRVHGKRYVYI